MASIDVNTLFARAEGAFQCGQFAPARSDLLLVLRAAGEHPAVLHLLALTEQRLGRVAEAGAAFRRALAKVPRDPQINNNFGNLLDEVGEFDAAIDHYSRALATAPAFEEARFNRATVLQKLGQFDAARADLDRVLTRSPGHAGALLTRGAVHRLAGRLDAAAADFAAVLDLVPDDSKALHGCARVAMERSEDERAVDLYQAALASAPGDPEITLGLAEALEAVGDAGAIPLLAAAVAREPKWISGHDSLARMRSEAGEATTLDASYVAARAVWPADPALAMAHAACLARASRHADALAVLDETGAARRDDARLMTAVLASEAGDLDRADAAFTGLGDDDQVQMARGRHALRRRDPAAAAALLEPVARAAGSVTAWAHLAIAWRLLDDSRFAWLCGQPGLWGVQDLGLAADDINALAAVLRGRHRTRTHPIGQSLRGGTQTRGRLFDRPEVEIRALEARLSAAIVAHVAALPPRDDTHPLLRHRDDAMRIEGSWSVRLSVGGFHVNHIHPRGMLSSAFYVALPPADVTARAGWLEIGAPPVELGLDLPPITTIEPTPGRLALFPSYFYHGTRPFDVGERLTVAFDVVA